MEFEFNPNKSVSNFIKHGIDFIDAQCLWDDPAADITPAKTKDEPRWIVTGCIEQVLWSAIITFRGDSIRIISVRRAREKEKIWYESKRV